MFVSPSQTQFHGLRSFSSVNKSSCSEIVEQLILLKPTLPKKQIISLNAYQIKNNLWNKILSGKDFEQFDETLYFRTLELYTSEKNLNLITPITIEEKMALIEVIQNHYAYFIGVPALREEVETLNTKQMNKLFSLLKEFKPNSKVSREEIESFASELFIILKGPPISLLDYFTENKTTLMSKRLYRIVQEELLLKGLKSVIMQFPEKNRYTLIEQAKIHINRISRHKLWRFTSLPWDLPFMDQIKLPDELLEKILLDGIDAHSDELITLFRKQKMIDHYERFRKVYRTTAFATAFTYFYNQQKAMHLNADTQEERKKQDFLDQFKKLSEIINSDSATHEKSTEELKDEQFKRNLEKFKEKYHENPTPAEYKEMKKIIYGNQ